ncbi:MAG: hypothetical protein QM689_11465 [Oscillospiraceae bacterium]
MQKTMKSKLTSAISMAAALVMFLSMLLVEIPCAALDAIAITTTKITLTGTDASVKLSGTDAAWVGSVTAVKVGGTTLDAASYSFNADGSTLTFIRTAATPIFTVLTAERTKEFDITISASGYADVTATLPVVNYGAKTFQVRVLDSQGTIKFTKTYLWADLEKLSSTSTAYYQSICGMAGLRSFAAKGVLVSSLLDNSGVTFGPGMTFKLRTNDKAATENDSATDNAYYASSEFTYEALMGTPRYYFPNVYTDTATAANKTNLLAAGKFDDAARTVIGSSGGEKAVMPMIALNYNESIFRSTSGAAPTAVYSPLITDERAFRFLFGLAKDPTDSTKISSETTTFSVSYCAFGFDIIDDHYDTHPVIVDGDASTSHVTDPITSVDTQYLDASVTFSEPIKITNTVKFINELAITFGGTAIPASSILGADLSDDGKILRLHMNMGFAAYGGDLKIRAANTTAVSVDDGTPASFLYTMIVPNGLETRIVSQTAATDTVPASVSTEILRDADCTRGMVHVILLKNGAPVGTLNTYGGTATSHFHMYLTMTATDFATGAATALKTAIGTNYTITNDGAVLTVTALTSAPGDVLEFHIVSYLNNGTKIVNKTALTDKLADVQAIDATYYTAASYTQLLNAAALAQTAVGSNYYAPSDVAAKVTQLSAAIDTLVLAPKNPIDPQTVTLSQTDYVYDGTAKTPAVTITGLTEGTDFTVAYADNTAAGTATVTITGINHYDGVTTKTFTIAKAAFSGITATGVTKTWDNKAASVTVTAPAGAQVTYSTDGTTFGTTNPTFKAVGTYTVYVKVTKENYADYTATASVEITAKSISGFTVSQPKDAVYTGSAIKPAVTLKNGATTLKSGTDYTVTYSANTAVGTAKVTVKGKGSYAGTITKTFKINPKATALTLTAGTKKAAVKWTKVSGASGYELYRASSKTGTFTKVKTTTATAFTNTGLTKGKTYYYKVRTYKTVNSAKYYSAYSSVKSVKAK